MTATHNGATSAPQPFRSRSTVLELSAPTRRGPGSVTTLEGQLFNATNAASANQRVVIYGSGIGASQAAMLLGRRRPILLRGNRSDYLYRAQHGEPGKHWLSGRNKVNINNVVVSNTTSAVIAPNCSPAPTDIIQPIGAQKSILFKDGPNELQARRKIGQIAMTPGENGICLFLYPCLMCVCLGLKGSFHQKFRPIRRFSGTFCLPATIEIAAKHGIIKHLLESTSF
jgi:hypothetical protein